VTKSIWAPGARVRVKASVADGTAGLTGVIQEVSYSKTEPATSVIFDGEVISLGAFYYDNELEAE
jgi:hypothetical protein